MCEQSDRIKQRLPDILSVSVPQTRSAELTLNPATLLGAAARLCVNRFLTALMTCGALKKNKKHGILQTHLSEERPAGKNPAENSL